MTTNPQNKKVEISRIITVRKNCLEQYREAINHSLLRVEDEMLFFKKNKEKIAEKKLLFEKFTGYAKELDEFEEVLHQTEFTDDLNFSFYERFLSIICIKYKELKIYSLYFLKEKIGTIGKEKYDSDFTSITLQTDIETFECYIGMLKMHKKFLDAIENDVGFEKIKVNWLEALSTEFKKKNRLLEIRELCEGVIQSNPGLINGSTTERMVYSALSGSLKYYVDKGSFKRTQISGIKNYLYGLIEWYNGDDAKKEYLPE